MTLKLRQWPMPGGRRAAGRRATRERRGERVTRRPAPGIQPIELDARAPIAGDLRAGAPAAVRGAVLRQAPTIRDPPFTFKVMVIRTVWPGATARQMQEEVTDRIARKLQETADVDFLRSYSRPGESTLFFSIKDSAPPPEARA